MTDLRIFDPRQVRRIVEELEAENERLKANAAKLLNNHLVLFRAADALIDCAAEFPDDPGAWGEHIAALTDAIIAAAPLGTNREAIADAIIAALDAPTNESEDSK